MGREIKRVPLDFEDTLPIGKIWQGFLMPDGLTEEEEDSWTDTEPPEGEGYQVWETVSEGSPVSPVFQEEYELIDWCVEQGYGRAAAKEFVKIGWVPSMVISKGQILRDIDSAILQMDNK